MTERSSDGVPPNRPATGVAGLSASGFDLALFSSDPRASARFYVDALGAEAVVDARPWRAEAAVSFGGAVIAFRTASSSIRSVSGGIYAAFGLRVVALLLDDLDATCARIGAAGRRVAGGVDLPGSRPIRFAKDLDGCMLELIGARPETGLDASPDPSRVQVGLTVRDEERSSRFYGETLGFAAQPRVRISEGITRHGFDVGRSTLKFWQPLEPVAASPLSGEPGIASVIMRVPDVDGVRRSLAARGVEAETTAGTSGVRCLDPDGNSLEWIAQVKPAPAA